MTARRKRWLRRLTIAISLAAFAAPAAAKPVPAASGMRIVSIDSGAIVDRTLATPQSRIAGTAARPDDRADRLATSGDAAPATSASNASVSWDGAVTLGLGTLVLVLALGLGVGYIRRPKIAAF